MLFSRFIKRALLILAALGVVAILAATIYVRTEAFGRLLRSQTNQLLAGSFRGDVTLGMIDTSIFGALVIHGLSIKDGGATIAWIPQIQLTYSLIPLLWHDVRLEVTAIDPVITLRRGNDGQWNLMKALAARYPKASSTSASAFSIYLDRLGVRNGTIDLTPQGPNRPAYRFTNADLDAGLTIKTAGLDVELSELKTRVSAPGMPPADLYARVSYNDTDGSAKVGINAVRVTTQVTAISISGVVRNFPTLDTDLSIAIDNLAASDVSTVLHNYPLHKDLKGNLTLTGNSKAMRLAGSLAAGNAQLTAQLQGDLTSKQPAFSGKLSLARFDLKTLTLPQNPAGMLDARIDAHGEGPDPHVLVADAKIGIQAFHVGAINAGNVNLAFDAQRGNLAYHGEFANGPGRVNLDGTAVVTGNPRYHLTLQTEHLDGGASSRSLPPTDLNSRMEIQGTGNHIENLNTQIDFRAVRSAVAKVPLESAVHAQIKAGVIVISQANVLSQGATLNLKGEAGILPGAQTQLSYELRVDRAAAWLQRAGTTGDGRLLLEGTASGVLRGPKGAALGAQGKIDLQTVRLPYLRIANGQLVYNFDRITQNGWPQGDATTQLAGLEANNLKLRSLAAQLHIDGGHPPHLSLTMLIRDRNNNTDYLAATASYNPKQINANLNQLTLVLPDGSWHLVHSAQFVKDSRHIAVEKFALANGVRQLSLDASIEAGGGQNIAVQARAIDLPLLHPLMPPGQQVAGELSTDITVRGTSAAPSIQANLEINHLAMNSQKIGDLNATVNYKPSAIALNATLAQEPNRQLSLTGEVPVHLNWTHGFAATIGNNENLRLYTDGISLAPLAGFASRTFKDAGGVLHTDLDLTGPPFHPAINGSLGITGGRGKIVPLGVTISDIEIGLRASPTSIMIVQLSAKAADGTLSGSGAVALNNYSPGAINVTLQIHRWPAIATQRYQAKIDGGIEASGTPEFPHLQGQIDVVDTTIHPDLDFLGGSAAPPPDNTIVVIRPGQERPAAGSPTSYGAATSPHGRPAANQSWKNLAMDLHVNLHRNTWIRHENAQAELDGKLTIKKRAGTPLTVIGEIDTVRGWLQFHTKRFTLASGQILFTGGSQIDPTLNIDAQYLVSDYTIDVIVTGFASKPEIKLQSQPVLAQGDILSVILFGTTSSQLSQGQKNTLQQQAQSMAVGAAGQALSESLGLESLGVDVNGESVGLGRYLNENTYVSVSPNFGANTSGMPSQVAAIQYFLRRWLTVTTATMSDGSRQVFLNANKRY
jgi:autotransporter translocation and assembly factor TamB